MIWADVDGFVLLLAGELKTRVSCFPSSSALIWADVDGFELLLDGALKIRASCFWSRAALIWADVEGFELSLDGALFALSKNMPYPEWKVSLPMAQ